MSEKMPINVGELIERLRKFDEDKEIWAVNRFGENQAILILVEQEAIFEIPYYHYISLGSVS